MIKNIFTILFIFLFTQSYAQSAFKLIKALKNNKITKSILICRNTKSNLKYSKLINDVVNLNNPHLIKSSLNCEELEIKLYSEFKIPLLRSPETLYGSYNYLKLLAVASKQKGVVEYNFINIWKNINKTQTYNGVHHIVNKSTLKIIHSKMKLEARSKGNQFTMNLAQLQNTAPATFHIFHGNPRFSHIFHNSEEQMRVYMEQGIKGVILAYFKQINVINRKNNIKQIPISVINNTLKEAELWSKTFNLKWE